MSTSAKRSKDWKDQLLRSGVPLEYEVANLLVTNGLTVNADFSFLRRDIIGEKELSVDLSGSWYGSKNGPSFELSVLVECKYRSDGKTILLVLDPNRPDYSGATAGGTLIAYDVLAPFKLNVSPLISLEDDLSYVYKIIEIHESSASEDDMRRAVNQIRYATPPLLKTFAGLYCLWSYRGR